MATTTNYGWTTPDDTALVKDGASAIRALGTAIDTSMNTALGTKKSGLVLLNTTSFSAVSSQSINDVFSSTYENYSIVLSNINGSTSTQAINFRLRKSGSDNSSNIYYRQELNANSTTVAGARQQLTSWTIAAARDQGPMNSFFDVTSPNQATIKTGVIGNFSYSSTSEVQYQSFAGTHDLATSADYDGFTIFPASGTMTGTVSVYGYNK